MKKLIFALLLFAAVVIGALVAAYGLYDGILTL